MDGKGVQSFVWEYEAGASDDQCLYQDESCTVSCSVGSMFNLVLLGAMFFQAGASTLCPVVMPDANDGVTVAPENHHVLLENVDVRVIEVTQAPHSKETMHTHARPSIFYLDGLTAIRYVVSGDEAHAVEQKAPPPGMKPLVAAVQPEGLHSVENLSDHPFHALRVELKHPGCDLVAKTAMLPDAKDALVVAPDADKLLFENQDVRVIDVVIAPHAKEPMHTHPWGGFVYLVHADRVETVGPNGTSEGVKAVPAGLKEIPAAAQGMHSTINLGDTVLHEVRFELKHGSVR